MCNSILNFTRVKCVDFELYISEPKGPSTSAMAVTNFDIYFNIKFHTRQMYGFQTLYKEPKGLSTSAMAVTNFNISITLASTVILLI